MCAIFGCFYSGRLIRIAEQVFQAAPGPREIDGGTGSAGKGSSSGDGDVFAEEEDGPWYPGRAREEFNRRRLAQKPEAVDQDDPVQVRGYVLPCR